MRPQCFQSAKEGTGKQRRVKVDIYLLQSLVVRMLGLDNVTLIHVLEINSSDAFKIANYNLLVPDKLSDRIIIPPCKLTLRGRRQHL